jgi:hypothetical protein
MPTFDASCYGFTAACIDNQTTAFNHIPPETPMQNTRQFMILTTAALVLSLTSGCAVIAVADAVVSTTATVVKTGVKATGAVIGAVIPD